MNKTRVFVSGMLAGSLALSLTLPAQWADAQIGGLGDKLKKKVEKKAEKEADKILAGDKAKKTKLKDEPGMGEPGKGPWVHYDFVPGSRVLFYEDFTADEVGNFPRRLEFKKGNMEVAEWESRRWLRASARSDFSIPLPEELPERFTLEVEYYSGNNTLSLIFKFGGEPTRPTANFAPHISGLRGGGVSAQTRSTDAPTMRAKPFHCRVMADGDYVKVFQNEQRVSNVPKAPVGRRKHIDVHIPGTSSNPVMITNLRVAAGGRKIYQVLLDEGRVVTHGILFDTDSDRIRPESTPTLHEIGTMMKEHVEMSLVIEGHTDDRGDDASNRSLSKRRAESVRAYLMKNYGIDGARLSPKGLGESQPAVENSTPEGRQNNRRVELVKG